MKPEVNAKGKQKQSDDAGGQPESSNKRADKSGLVEVVRQVTAASVTRSHMSAWQLPEPERERVENFFTTGNIIGKGGACNTNIKQILVDSGAVVNLTPMWVADQVGLEKILTAHFPSEDMMAGSVRLSTAHDSSWMSRECDTQYWHT